MDNVEIKRLKQIFSALDNEYRLKIIKLCSNKTYTVTELSKLLKLNYSITVEYTSMLEKAGLLQKTRNKDRTASVKSLIGIDSNGEIKRI
ncbi:MAG: winged helix-turn-helix domain-containing protein [archaeon]